MCGIHRPNCSIASRVFASRMSHDFSIIAPRLACPQRRRVRLSLASPEPLTQPVDRSFTSNVVRYERYLMPFSGRSTANINLLLCGDDARYFANAKRLSPLAAMLTSIHDRCSPYPDDASTVSWPYARDAPALLPCALVESLESHRHSVNADRTTISFWGNGAPPCDL